MTAMLLSTAAASGSPIGFSRERRRGTFGGVTELQDGEGANAYGDSILVGNRVRLRGLRDEDLPILARWDSDPGRMATASNWVVPPS